MTRKTALLVATLGMLTAALALRAWSLDRPTETLAQPLQRISSSLGGWHLVSEHELTPGVRNSLRATSYLARTYSDGRTTLDLFIAYYAVQRAGESMHSPKHCLPGAGWEISGHEELSLRVPGETAIVNRYEIQKGSEHALTIYWYQSRNHIIANEYRAKALLAYDSIFKGRTDGSIVRIVSPDGPQSEHAAEEFAKLVIPEMRKCFGVR